MSVTIVKGDILAQDADVIVNPANGHLRHSGGLARIIDQAATAYDEADAMPKVVTRWHLDHRDAPLIATGNVHATTSGLLSFKAVIHAVGPIWNGGRFCEARLLESAHDAAFDTARALGFKSIAVPAISCGIFGFPVEKAAPIACGIAAWHPDLDIRFVLFQDDHYEAYLSAHKEYLSC